jgi:hypothetical protein
MRLPLIDADYPAVPFFVEMSCCRVISRKK